MKNFWNPIVNLKTAITTSILRQWLKEADLIADDGYIKPEATVEKFGNYVWETRYKSSLRYTWQQFAEGSIRIGPVTIHGANAMRFAINIRRPKGYLCIRPPSFTFNGSYFPPYAYFSADGTPRNSEWGWCGRGGADGWNTRSNLAIAAASTKK